MIRARRLIICVLLLGLLVAPARAQRLKINYVVPPQQSLVAARLHPAAKGALIGAIR